MATQKPRRITARRIVVVCGAVVALNTELNRRLEDASDSARDDADRIRRTARIAVLGCFALAIAAAHVGDITLEARPNGTRASLCLLLDEKETQS